MPVCSLTLGARNGDGEQDQLRQVNSQWEAEMMRLVEQLDVAQQQLKQQLTGPGGAADPAEVARLKKQLADEAEDNDALSEQLVVLDSDHQKLQEKNEALVKENEIFRKENERLLKLNAAVRVRCRTCVLVHRGTFRGVRYCSFCHCTLKLGWRAGVYAQLEARASTAEGGYTNAGQDVTELARQLEAAGTRLEELVEENEDLQIKCKELELRETTLQEVPARLATRCLSCLAVILCTSASVLLLLYSSLPGDAYCRHLIHGAS